MLTVCENNFPKPTERGKESRYESLKSKPLGAILRPRLEAGTEAEAKAVPFGLRAGADHPE